MPKKRFNNLYSKPPSTVHPSLNSTAASSSSSNHNDAPPTVNELISSLRRSHVSPTTTTTPSTVVTRTLPPQIRQLLSQPETPTPRPRDRRQRFDAAGRRLPPGPPPPRSWVESRHTPAGSRNRDKERLYPHDINDLPGIRDEIGGAQRRTLLQTCLRTMARDWEFLREYESNNLADLPTGLRMLLLSHIAVYGPDDGIGTEGLNNLLMVPNDEEDMPNETGNNNEGFFRLDLSGSVGRSVSFKQLIDLVQKRTTVSDEDEAATAFSWEDSLSRSISTTITIPHLTHLSISHPPSTISWPRLLTFTKHVPTLTHLSLAYWPVPSLTPNAKTAVMSSPYGKDIQYGGTNYYSHSLDEDFREAGAILKRLANHSYNLEYLDLEGCSDWLQALRWTGEDAGIDWGNQWAKLKTINARCGYVLQEESEYWEIEKFTRDFKRAFLLQKYISRVVRKGRWVEVVNDPWEAYDGLWKDGTEESQRKRNRIDGLKAKWWTAEVSTFPEEAVARHDVERRSVWEQ